jgi:hypothetical protein
MGGGTVQGMKGKGGKRKGGPLAAPPTCTPGNCGGGDIDGAAVPCPLLSGAAGLLAACVGGSGGAMAPPAIML